MQTLRTILLAGLGGFIGSAGRYLIGGWTHGLMPLTSFPVGTLVVNISGCFLIRLLGGLEGFGAHSRLHTAKVLRLSTDLPIVVEIVDTIVKIEAFLPVIDGAIREGLATLERVDIRFYRSGPESR
jgi:PII-like signaling protein